MASSFMYRDMIKQLSPNNRCIAIDFPGFGLSEAEPGFQYSIQSLAAVIEKFIGLLHLKDFYVMIQEIGGHAALSVLMKRPELVKGLLLTDCLIFPVSQYPKVGRMLKLMRSPVFGFLNTTFNLLPKLVFGPGIKLRKLSPEVRQTYSDLFDTKEKRARITKLIGSLSDQEKLLQDIQRAFETVFNNTPALLIYGEKDAATGYCKPIFYEDFSPEPKRCSYTKFLSDQPRY